MTGGLTGMLHSGEWLLSTNLPTGSCFCLSSVSSDVCQWHFPLFIFYICLAAAQKWIGGMNLCQCNQLRPHSTYKYFSIFQNMTFVFICCCSVIDCIQVSQQKNFCRIYMIRVQQTMETLSQSTSAALQTSLQSVSREILLPSFDRACQNMFQQVATVFQAGTQECTLCVVASSGWDRTPQCRFYLAILCSEM